MTDIDSQPDRDEPGDDRYDEYKDGVAMGYINPDGSYREPDEPDWEILAGQQHAWAVHDGGACDCPPDLWELPEGETYAEEAPF